MTIPLDNLYNFLNNVIDHDIIIYRWTPHGSKLLKDLKLLNPTSTLFNVTTKPIVICHDQEPLDFNRYSWDDFVSILYNFSTTKQCKQFVDSWLHTCSINQDNFLNSQFLTVTGDNLYNGYILVHSEKNSGDVTKYQTAGAVSVHYWSHALIARDWFRYAQFDPLLSKEKNIKKDFLVYNRAWGGLREYRLKFSELVVDCQLELNCLMNFSKFDSGEDYRHHQFKNSKFKLARNNLENYFISSTASSSFSAEYNPIDYNQCLIDVVLETVFDDQRIHLTEKTLRPISCKTPFILAAGPGSLQYLRDYGFQTFGSLWDESYDTITDSSDRLRAIVGLMKKISQLSDLEKRQLYQQSQEICEYNHRHFFSSSFFEYIVDEYRKNLTAALDHLTPSKETLANKLNSTLAQLESHSLLNWYYQNIADKKTIDKLYNYCGLSV